MGKNYQINTSTPANLKSFLEFVRKQIEIEKKEQNLPVWRSAQQPSTKIDIKEDPQRYRSVPKKELDVYCTRNSMIFLPAHNSWRDY
ncbi:hypothetical protein T09_3907 [Trichinella sp. T9]|nr:hypothetical protein T09_3907 [Trichinella sp. T9]